MARYEGDIPLTSDFRLFDSRMLFMVETHSPPVLVGQCLAGSGRRPSRCRRSGGHWSRRRRSDGYWCRGEYGGHIGRLAGQHTRPLRHDQWLKLRVRCPRGMHSRCIDGLHGQRGITGVEVHAVKVLHRRLVMGWIVCPIVVPARGVVFEVLVLVVGMLLLVVHLHMAHDRLRWSFSMHWIRAIVGTPVLDVQQSGSPGGHLRLGRGEGVPGRRE
jgi:hypothetical protein